ncbi:hypothetical protein OPT61_g1634 [Boeremia exigua]|uniref:Uncharacterized protein n=1 Tax=Boeremia exigua TaxID=749465 RepID=A0ACC2IPC9_9PLEO|nr:hypothetical protein OPT61_g1634 [Boeremia exigua]
MCYTPESTRNSQSTSPEPLMESLSNLPWQDETRDFSMLAVRATLRSSNEQPGELVMSYNWYPDAVPVDSLLPPGVSLSAKEICIYYPHHIRWQDIMLRLSLNDYRGPDILGIQTLFRGKPQHHMSPPALNQIQRDTVQRLLPDFKTAGYEGKGDSSICVDNLKPGAHLVKKFKGYVVPSFDDILRGLTSLPQGEDSRGFTHCLAWYLRVRSTFTPRLELNVLHAQSLIRALRQPLEPAHSQNLNRLALEQWRERQTLPMVEITTTREYAENETSDRCLKDQNSKSRAVFNIYNDPVDLKLQINIPIRHVLTLPFLALHSVVADAFKTGIDKAEHQRAVRKSILAPAKLTAKANVMRKGIV